MNQPQPLQQPPQQPDFAVINDKFRTLGTGVSAKLTEIGNDFSTKCAEIGQELGLCPNLPPIAQGNEILNMLRRMDTRLVRIETRQGEMDTRLRRIEAAVDQLNNRALAGESNVVARAHNSITFAGKPLAALYSPTTNELIEDFPATRGDLDELSHMRVVDLLRQLGQPIDGTPDEKRSRLKCACGILLS
ncbi:hypothetical protein GGR51DRAFT_530156, partial [Nemania sp. FL0031]